MKTIEIKYLCTNTYRRETYQVFKIIVFLINNTYNFLGYYLHMLNNISR